MKSIFNENSSKEKVDKVLKREYRLGIWEFSRCLYIIAAFHKAHRLKKNIYIFKEKIEKLNRFKSELTEKLKKIIDDYNFNFPIKDFFNKHECQEGKIDDSDFIIDFFQVKHTFEIIDEKIKFLEDNIKFLEEYGFERKKKPLRIEPINLIILVWGLQIRLDSKGTHEDDFVILTNLIRWFNKHTRWAEFYNWQSHFSDNTVKLTFFKYIKHRKRKDPKKTKSKFYIYLAEWLRLECFYEDHPRHITGLLPNEQELDTMKETGIYEPTDSLLHDNY